MNAPTCYLFDYLTGYDIRLLRCIDAMYSMNRTWTKDDKWTQPGWRIEQKYANKVLIGNWMEDRLQVGTLSATYCLLFVPYAV